MSLSFEGTRWIPVSELGLSQTYLSARELDECARNFSTEYLCANPILVYDFGNDRLTITAPPSLHMAYLAWKNGMSAVPVAYDPDEYLQDKHLLPLLADEVYWCEKINLHSVADLAHRILNDEDYERLFIRRCERSSDLCLETNPAHWPAYAALRPDLHLYGISDDLRTLYFENEQEVETAVPVPEHLL